MCECECDSVSESVRERLVSNPFLAGVVSASVWEQQSKQVRPTALSYLPVSHFYSFIIISSHSQLFSKGKIG